jgi:hypothetical protein
MHTHIHTHIHTYMHATTTTTTNRFQNTTLLHQKMNWLMLFKEIIAVYFENHVASLSTNCRVAY